MELASGKSHGKGIASLEFNEILPDEETARVWFETIRWPDGNRHCPKCGSTNTVATRDEKPMPYRCRDCRKHFSVRTASVLERSHIPLHKWAWGIYLSAISPKGVSSMKLHRDLKITQKSACFMAHRIRNAMRTSSLSGITVETNRPGSRRTR